jgi:anti-sigma factor RsiW
MSDHHETNCETLAESIGLFASGDLPARDLVVIGEHLRSCEDCRRRLEELQRIADSLAVVDPAWLETAGDTVLKRVAAELVVDNQVLSREPAPVADNSRGGERNVSRQQQRGRRGWTWIALGALAAGLVGIALSGWLGDWWKSVPEQPVVPESIVEASPSVEPRVSEVGNRLRSEFPTCWEMQRALAESDDAFQRTLARGRSAAYSEPLNLNHLLEELAQ